MTIARTGELAADAASRGRGIAAFNVITLEHAEAIVAGAEAAGVAVILQISENAVAFHGGQLAPVARASAEIASAATVPVALHLDHVTTAELAGQAAGCGLSSVMYDAGALPYEHNVDRTAAVTERLHRAGLWVEAELGYVGGKPDAPLSAHAAGVLTDPDEAADFVTRTNVDALAVAVGSSHAMTTRTAELNLERIAQLRAAVGVPLVLHGSSGVPDRTLSEAVAAGITKVNVGTALNVAMTDAVRRCLAGDPELTDPRRYLAPARAAIADVVTHLTRVVG